MNENKFIQTIALGADWKEVLAEIIAEEGMDPMSIDLIKLSDSFLNYLKRLRSFDFRIPARFILIAATLLRIKCELLLKEEEEKIKIKEEPVPKIKLDEIPQLAPPMARIATRKVSLNELIDALNKAFEFRERKEEKKFRLRRAVVNLIDKTEDIESIIKRVFEDILRHRKITFSELVPVWKRKEIVDTFLSILYLTNRGKITCRQEEFFKEIYIEVR